MSSPERPLIMPIYLSSPAFNLASMTSYSTFCFMQHLRLSAFLSDTGSLRDGLAESFWYYSQNLPTVTLLLPRAGLSLALLLSFSSPNASVQLELADANLANRDSTFFGQDGSLTRYARGVLIANATWTAWRVLVLLISWSVHLFLVFNPLSTLSQDRTLDRQWSRLRWYLWSTLPLGRRGHGETSVHPQRSWLRYLNHPLDLARMHTNSHQGHLRILSHLAKVDLQVEHGKTRRVGTCPRCSWVPIQIGASPG